MTNRTLVLPFLFALFTFHSLGAKPQDAVPQRIASDVWEKLHAIHWFPYEAYAESLEREEGLSREEFLNLILGFALDETRDNLGRERAVQVHTALSLKSHGVRSVTFLDHTNAMLRTTALSVVMNHLPTIGEKLDFARERLDWIAKHPECQKDAIDIYGTLSGCLVYEHPTSEETISILALCREEAEKPGFASSAVHAFGILRRFDPEWMNSDAFIRFANRWLDDPAYGEYAQTRLREALEARNAGSTRVPPSDSQRRPTP